MTTTDLRTLCSFNAWANERVFGAVTRLPEEAYRRDLGSSHGGVHGTLGSASAYRARCQWRSQR